MNNNTVEETSIILLREKHQKQIYKLFEVICNHDYWFLLPHEGGPKDVKEIDYWYHEITGMLHDFIHPSIIKNSKLYMRGAYNRWNMTHGGSSAEQIMNDWKNYRLKAITQN